MNVGFKKDVRIHDRAVDMTLRRKVDDNVRFLLLKEPLNRLAVRDGLLYKAEVRLVEDRLQGGQVSCIGQAVEADDPVLRMGFHFVEDKVGTDEAGSAGDDDIHKQSPFCVSDQLTFRALNDSAGNRSV